MTSSKFNSLPSKFILSYGNFTFKMVEENGHFQSVNPILRGDDLSVRMTPEGSYLNHLDRETGESIWYLFKGIVRDTEHPSSKMYRIHGMNRHFCNHSDTLQTHCDCKDCPVKF